MPRTSVDFLAQVEGFIEKHHISPSTFGRLMMGDPTFVFQLRDGRQPSIDTCASISRIISHPKASSIFGRKGKRR